MKISSYKDLVVWQKSVALVTIIYRMSREFPREELYALTSQLRRSAVSVPSNIAEGWGRKSTKEYIQFLKIARGSLFEMETQIIIARNLDYIKDIACEQLLSDTEEIGKMTNALVNSLED